MEFDKFAGCPLQKFFGLIGSIYFLPDALEITRLIQDLPEIIKRFRVTQKLLQFGARFNFDTKFTSGSIVHKKEEAVVGVKSGPAGPVGIRLGIEGPVGPTIYTATADNGTPARETDEIYAVPIALHSLP